MASKTLAFKLRIDLAAIGSLIVLTLGFFSTFFLLFVPAAVAILLRLQGFYIRFLVGGFFLAHFFLLSKRGLPDGSEILFTGLLFLMGISMRLITLKKGSFNFVVYSPLALTVLSGLAFYFSERAFGLTTSFLDWSRVQLNSSVFTNLLGLEGWPESLIDFYQKVMAPVLEKGFLGWFSFMLSFVFFINSAVENSFKSSKKSSVAWKRFVYWKSNDWGLLGLVIGLLFLILNSYMPVFSGVWMSQLGWHLLILSLFPVMIQGASLASYFVPRVGAFFALFIFVLLFWEPLPVLLLAGFCDLWFDLRSKIKFEPKNE